MALKRNFCGLLALVFGLIMIHPGTAQAEGDSAILMADPERTVIAAGVWTSEDGSKVTYESQYFEAYQAVTAADMLRWVPGGAELLPRNGGNNNKKDKRGFGSGGDQILINGKRLSGKSNDIGSAMQRIQANLVSRVELIRGTSPGLDVRSEGTLINVVLSEEISGGAGSWQLHSGFYGNDTELDGLISYSNSAGRLNYLVSAELGPYNRGNDVDRYEEYFTPDSGVLTERREINEPELKEALVLNSSVGWSFANGDMLNLNGRIADRDEFKNETTQVFVVGVADTNTLENTSTEQALEWELGGDLEQEIGRGVLKTRLIYALEDEQEGERIAQTSTDPGNVPAQSLVETDSVRTETIIRSSYSWTLRNGQNVELGAEGARNTLETDVALFAVGNDGTLTPVTLFNADSDVNEDRFEFFSTHFWQFNDTMALESALNVEHSKIAQEGLDVDTSRAFTYVKPRFDLRWDINDSNQLRGSAERMISQLNFSDFVANFDSDDVQVAAGNPDLEPEKAWRYQVTYEHRLANDTGVVEAQLFYRDIEDHIDNIRVTDTTSAAGNIGDAMVMGMTLKGSVRLSGIGLDGAVLDANVTVRDSEATDPFTGEKRKMSYRQKSNYGVNFRHDIPSLRFNYNVEVDWNGKRYANDINYRESSQSVNPRTSVNMQYRLTDRIVLWFDTRLVFDGHGRRFRERYDGNVADGILLRREVRDQYYRREHIVGLRGQF